MGLVAEMVVGTESGSLLEGNPLAAGRSLEARTGEMRRAIKANPVMITVGNLGLKFIFIVHSHLLAFWLM